MIDVLTFGCRLNALESEVMRRRAAESGLRDALLVNSCAVTGEAVRQARQAIRREKRAHPQRPVVVAGCAAQIDPATFAAMPEVDLVLGNVEKLRPESYRPVLGGVAGSARIDVQDIMIVTETAQHLVDGIDGRTRGFLEVQNGCDHRCTFCVIPYGRGNSRSLPRPLVLEAARRLLDAGHAELVLTGVDITAYGADLGDGSTLGTLVRDLLRALPDLRRLRLSSIDSIEVDDDLVEAIAGDDRLMPHLHLSLQSGDDLILRRMKRRHRRADAVAFTERLRRLRPDIVFGADLIAGFPTETEEAFENTLRAIDECGLTFLHVFPFSSRPGTPASRMPQHDGTVVRERASRLRVRATELRDAFLSREVGRQRAVLVERGGRGRTEHFTPVEIAGHSPGAIVTATIIGRSGDALLAEAA